MRPVPQILVATLLSDAALPREVTCQNLLTGLRASRTLARHGSNKSLLRRTDPGLNSLSLSDHANGSFAAHAAPVAACARGLNQAFLSCGLDLLQGPIGHGGQICPSFGGSDREVSSRGGGALREKFVLQNFALLHNVKSQLQLYQKRKDIREIA